MEEFYVDEVGSSQEPKIQNNNNSNATVNITQQSGAIIVISSILAFIFLTITLFFAYQFMVKMQIESAL